MVGGCRCATSWCDLDLTFDLVVVTMTFKILYGLFFGLYEMYYVNTWLGHRLVCVGMHHHGVTINFGSAEVCSPATFETCFSYGKDIWIAATD